MPFKPQTKKTGDLVQSQDWNDAIEELLRLEKDKVNRSGNDKITGPLTIEGTLSAKEVTFSGALTVNNISVSNNVTISSDLATLGNVSIGIPTAENENGWDRVLDIKGTRHTKLSIRTQLLNIDGRVLVHHKGFWEAPAGMMVGTHSNHPLSFATNSLTRLTILNSGNVGIGTTEPKAKLDIALVPRSGTHPTTVKGLYVTGDFKDDSDGVEFRHTNGTQGIGFGSNTIYAAGSNANQDLGLQAKGTGEVKVTGKLSVSGNLTVTGKVNERNISADGLKLDAHTHNGTDSQKVKHSNLTLDGGTNPHKTTAADVGALSTSGGTVSGDLSVTGSLSFGSSMRQMLNLWGTNYAIGVQSHTQYFRSGYNFAWYKGGSHNDAAFNAGTGGTSLMTLDSSGNLSVLGTISPAGSNPNQDLGLKAKGTGQVKVAGKLSVTGGVIQQGGDPITTTNDLGLYSQSSGSWMRFVTKSAPFKFFSDGGAGTTPIMTLESSGDLSVLGTISPAGTETNKDLVLKGKGTGQVKVKGELSTSDLSVSGDVTVTGDLTLSKKVKVNAPDKRLHVIGDLVLGNDTNGQKFIFHSRTSGTGDFLQITNDKSNGEWDWHEAGGITLKRGGNVGIGTQSPQAKLDVKGDVKVSGSVSFGLQARQMLNLWDNTYGIGIQSYTQYFRTSGNFAWYKGGSHDDGVLNAGSGGTSLMTLDGSGNLKVSGKLSVTSDLTVSGLVNNRDISDDGRKLDTHINTNVTTNPHRTTAADVRALSTSGGTVSGNLSVTGSLSFGSTIRQMLNLYGTVHAIGVQNNTKYFRTSGNFAWYKGGSHNDAAFNAGTNGTSLMTLDVSGNLSVLGTISPAGTETNKDLGLKAKGTGKVKIDSSAIITGKVGIGTTDPKAKLDVNGSVKFGENGTIINQMICGQVFYNTSTSKWQYSTSAKNVKVLKIDRAEFRIYYGFTVKSAQELMILATTFEKRADHTACVREIHQDNCVICIINTKTQDQKEQNFSFMIVHCQAPPDTDRFLDVDNRKEKEYRTDAPVDPYYYTL
jgi:hypothetical protein